MIIPEVAITLLAIDAALTVYAFYDKDNRLYMNIVGLILGTMFSFYLASAFITGAVVMPGTVVQDTASNTSGTWTNTTYTYLDLSGSVQDAGLMWLMVLVGIVQAVVVLLLVIDAIYEYRYSEEEGHI